jgi:6-phosphogluconolactonase/glucosamine-6-phosphate isomerase/deaminase
LEEREAWVAKTEDPRRPYPRMTFTYPLINAARRVWVLAPGAGKRKIAEHCLQIYSDEESRHTFPINGVRLVAGDLVWWLTYD